MEYLVTTPLNKPHQHISSLISYLQVIFSLLSILPPSIRDAAHFTAMKNIANKITDLFYEYEVWYYSFLWLLLDSIQPCGYLQSQSRCLLFGVFRWTMWCLGFDVLIAILISMNRLCFQELRQLLNYLLSGDLKQVLNNEYYVTNLECIPFRVCCLFVCDLLEYLYCFE